MLAPLPITPLLPYGRHRPLYTPPQAQTALENEYFMLAPSNRHQHQPNLTNHT